MNREIEIEVDKLVRNYDNLNSNFFHQLESKDRAVTDKINKTRGDYNRYFNEIELQKNLSYCNVNNIPEEFIDYRLKKYCEEVCLNINKKSNSIDLIKKLQYLGIENLKEKNEYSSKRKSNKNNHYSNYNNKIIAGNNEESSKLEFNTKKQTKKESESDLNYKRQRKIKNRRRRRRERSSK